MSWSVASVMAMYMGSFSAVSTARNSLTSQRGEGGSSARLVLPWPRCHKGADGILFCQYAMQPLRVVSRGREA